jgi:hypothetical protein
MSDRSKISEGDRRFIIGKSGGRCNKCRLEVFVENEFSERARLGDDAHIIAASDIGPRALPIKSSPERNSALNLILLCKICHSEVDQQPRKYSEEILLKIRVDHYSWVDQSLGQEAIKRPQFHYLTYINVPRADMYAVSRSISLPKFSAGESASIRELGINAGRLMASYTQVLNHEELYANKLNSKTAIGELSVGSYWFSDAANYRSRKVIDRIDLVSAWSRLENVIYRKFEGWRLYCLIDPRWITTSTAYSTLAGGTLISMGLLHIQKIDTQQNIVIASPLFLGDPDHGLFR